jgi:two-component system, NarL family, nitrate/nitrite response regulator NarL
LLGVAAAAFLRGAVAMNTVRTIVVDAQALVADGLRYRSAQIPGLEVVADARSGRELLALLPTLRADLVLLDVSLPEMDGIDTMKVLRKQYPHLKVLAHSALLEIEYVNSMLIEGAHGYLVKNGPIPELTEAIDVVMNDGRYISPLARESVAKGYSHTDKRMDGEYIGLTAREREVIRMIAQERTNEEIADALFVSVDTVKTHRKNLMTKLNVRNIAGLVKYAVDIRWV